MSKPQEFFQSQVHLEAGASGETREVSATEELIFNGNPVDVARQASASGLIKAVAKAKEAGVGGSRTDSFGAAVEVETEDGRD